MIVKREKNQIVVRFSVNTDVSKIQSVLNYLRYIELTSNSNASEKDIENLVMESKSNRWNTVKKEIGLDD